MSAELGCKGIRLAVAISGTGRGLQNLIQTGYDIRHVFSSRYVASGLNFAKAAGIPTTVHSFTHEEHDKQLYETCRKAEVDLLILAGFLKHLTLPEDFRFRVMNIHPSLLPAFGGEGYYGSKVHEAVLARGCKISGCTVHFVDDEYDHGPIILQRAVHVHDDDDVESLAQRVFEAETAAYPQAINLYAAGRLCVAGGVVRVLPEHE